MMAVTTKVKSSNSLENLRPFNPRRDSAAVADLIESGFSDTLDPDGRRYLDRMRAACAQKGISRWINLFFRSSFKPLAGFVWEENGEIVGNLSLVPFSYKGHRINMIANVAVSPPYRRKGIARALTSTALERSKRERVKATWLQVRNDNHAAINLYQSLGFSSKARRTTWIAKPTDLISDIPSSTRISIRRRNHWPQQKQWLDQNYPIPLRWYFFLDIAAMRPGIISGAHKLINELEVHHWTVLQNDSILGVVSWQRSSRYYDYLWLAAPPESESTVLATVLPVLRRLRWVNRPISLDYPDNRAADSLLSAGFSHKVTLNWMEVSHIRGRSNRNPVCK
jgi:ribosomal protein S18 acetylase RimI-like enzyme